MALIQSQGLDAESTAAFRSVRTAKNIFMILTLIAIVAVPFATIMAAFTGVMDAKTTAASAPASAPAASAPAAGAETPATAPAGASTQPAGDYTRSASAWRYTLSTLMTVVCVLAPLVAILSVISLFMGANLSVVSRSGGTGGFFSAFFWGIAMMATLVPWQNIMPGTQLAGITTSLGQIISDANSSSDAGTTARMFFYWRFLAYPAIAFLLWLMAMLKFARGYNAMNTATTITPTPAAPKPQNEPARPTEPTAKI